MAITNVGMYSKPHGTQGGGGGGTTIYKGSVSGSDLPSDLNVTSITASDGHIDDITGKTLSYNEGSFLYIYSKDGNISKLRGDELKYTKGKIDKFEADEITCNGNITTQDLHSETGWINELNSKYITTDYLTVNKQAHFFELIIDKVRSVGGTLILTQANCVADYVKAYDSNDTQVILDTNTIKEEIKTAHPTWTDEQINDEVNDVIEARVATVVYYDVFWLARDKNSGRTVDNDWLVNDQAFCTSFNVHEGTNYDISNKYYWRLVTDILGDRYMNIRSGAELPLSQESQASVNSVTINAPTISYVVNGNDNVINTGWYTKAQNVDGIITVTWTQTSGGAGQQTYGTMTTTNTVFGIQMSPIDGTSLISAVPQKFYFTCTAARLNVGVYYQDGTSEYFPAPDVATTSYEFTLKRVKDEQGPQGPQGNQGPTYHSETNTPIEAVVITNADEVEWQLVHGIRLSNTDKDVPENHPNDQFYDDKYSIPSIGDNIAQLGYRPSGTDDPNLSRGNAIIIAAYKTPDGGTGVQGDLNENPIAPPSYAQYESIGKDTGYEFNLAHYRRTFMDSNRSVFKGNFYTGSGGTWTDIEEQIQAGAADLFYLYVAYCNDPNEPNPQLYDPTTPTAAYNWCIAPDMPGGVSWGYMGFCSMPIDIQKDPVTGQPTETEQQAIDRVKGTLTFADFGFNEVPGGSGTPGGHWVSCYKNSTEKYNNQVSELAPPNVGNVAKRIDELPYDGWYAEPQTLPTPGPQVPQQYTWESQAFVSGSGAYQLWQPAIRITGADGTPGTDGNDIEFIYCQDPGDHDGDPVNIPAPPNGHTLRDDWPATYDPITGEKTSDNETITVGGKQYTWYDNPQGITETIKYEYVAERMKRAGNWTDYSTPRVWSSWGKKGTDGDGYEYIFKTYGDPMPVFPDDNYQSAGDADPRNWDNSSAPDAYDRTFDDDDYLGPAAQGWTDDPQDLNATDHKYQFQAQRKKYVHEGETKARWDSFSKPSLWTQYVPQGSQGVAGSHTEFLYKNATTNPGIGVWPNDHSDLTGYTKDMLINLGWSESQTTPDFDNNEFTWQTYCTVSGTGTYGGWNYPSRITGANGKDGEDGADIEFIYCQKSTAWANPVAPTIADDPTVAQDDWPNVDGHTPSKTINGTTWWDNPQGVTEQLQYEYVAQRTKPRGSSTWDPYTTPSIWSKWGERGKDGDGFEYIYRQSNTLNVPNPTPSGYQTNANYQNNDEYADFLPDWEDDPQGVSESTPYELVSVRKRTTVNNVSKWGPFSDPALWSQWVPEGSQGPAGKHTEFLYKNTTTNPGVNVWPLPAGTTRQTLITTYGWSIAQTTPDFEHGEYTWQTYCVVSGTGEYETWNYPSRISGDNGKDGEDGSSTEFIYRRFNQEIDWTNNQNNLNPNYWAANQNPDYVGPTYSSPYSDSNKWTDNPNGVDDTYQFEYVATREFKYQTAGATEKTWGKFSEPAIWSKWGERGKDGDGYEYIFRVSNTTNVPNPTPTGYQTNTNYQNNDEYAPFLNDWYDDPQNVSSSTPYELVSVRKKTNEKWGPFSDPALWAQYVPQGTQGPAGPQGPMGANGSGYKLMDTGSKAYYGLDLNSYNDITCNFVCNMKFQVAYYHDETITMLTATQLSNAGLAIWVQMAQASSLTDSKSWYKLTGSGTSFTYSFDAPWFWSDDDKKNFCNNNTYFTVAIADNNTYSSLSSISNIQDSMNIPMQITANAVAAGVNRDKNNNARYDILVTNVDNRFDTVTNNINILSSDIDGIESSVTKINTQTIPGVQGQVNGVQGQVNGVQGQVNGVQSESNQKIVGVQSQINSLGDEVQIVVSNLTDLSDDVHNNYASKGYVDVTANNAAIGVQNRINGQLVDTGINIGNQTINLKAGKVNFLNSSGSTNPYLSIDSSGKLKATDGEFSGKITASSGSITGDVNLGPANGYHIVLDPDDRSLKGYSNSSNQTFELSAWYSDGSLPILRMKDPQTESWTTFAPKQWSLNANHGNYYSTVRSQTEYGGDGYAQFQLYYMVTGYSVTASAEIKAKWNDLEIVLVGLPTSQPTKTGRVWVDSDGYLRIKK